MPVNAPPAQRRSVARNSDASWIGPADVHDRCVCPPPMMSAARRSYKSYADVSAIRAARSIVDIPTKSDWFSAPTAWRPRPLGSDDEIPRTAAVRPVAPPRLGRSLLVSGRWLSTSIISGSRDHAGDNPERADRADDAIGLHRARPSSGCLRTSPLATTWRTSRCVTRTPPCRRCLACEDDADRRWLQLLAVARGPLTAGSCGATAVGHGRSLPASAWVD